MTDLTVRRLLIDLETPVPRHWCGGDAFLTAWFNALSMSFPVGEQFFIDSVREAAKRLTNSPEHMALRETIAGFVGQEAAHRHVHGAYNVELERQGLENRWAERALKRLRAIPPGANPLHALAVTCAYEHCTAVFADLTLRHPELLAGADARLAALWTWHAAEETEHKSVAFDLYLALGGNHRWRVRWFVTVLWLFATDSLRQTVHNLRRDGTLWRWRTWASAASFFFGRRGMAWLSCRPMLDYLRRDFRPWQHDNAEAARGWLRDNAALFRVVR
jgi:predicted metal-dependent hydrolase